MKVRLSVQHRKANVKTVVLHSDAVIGRSTDCNLRLASGQVSRKHCQLFIDDIRVAVMDLGSSNGTFLNGSQLEANVETPLPPGAELEIGPVRFTVEYDDPNADTSIRKATAERDGLREETPFAEGSKAPPSTPASEPPRPLLVAKAARKQREPDPDDPLGETDLGESSGLLSFGTGEPSAPAATDSDDEDDQDDDDSETGDSDSSSDLEGSADETSEGFKLNLRPGSEADPHEETFRMPPDSDEESDEGEMELPEEEDDDDSGAPKKAPDDNFMDFLQNLDE